LTIFFQELLPCCSSIKSGQVQVHHRGGERLDEWLARVTASHISELQRLVRSIQKDKAAVQAGLTLTYSNDHVA
jgi:transposase